MYNVFFLSKVKAKGYGVGPKKGAVAGHVQLVTLEVPVGTKENPKTQPQDQWQGPYKRPVVRAPEIFRRQIEIFLVTGQHRTYAAIYIP